MEKVRLLSYLLAVVPVLVILMEYTAISAAIAYARFSVEYNRPVVDLLGGIIKVGDNLSYEAVPRFVTGIHLAALLLSVAYLVCFIVTALFRKDDTNIIPPQEG